MIGGYFERIITNFYCQIKGDYFERIITNVYCQYDRWLF